MRRCDFPAHHTFISFNISFAGYKIFYLTEIKLFRIFKVTLFTLIILCCGSASSQDREAEALLESGKKLHFDGKYDSAIQVLQSALDAFIRKGEQPQEIEAAYALGESMTNAGQCEQAQKIIEDAVEKGIESLDITHPLIADGYYYLSRAYGGCARQFEKALQTLRNSTKIRLEKFGVDSYEMSFNYTMMGYFNNGLGNYDSAIFYLQKAVEIRERLGVPDSLELSHTLSLLSTAYDSKGEVQEALEMGLQALRIRERTLVPFHPSISNSFNDIGNVYKNLGNFERALDYYLRSLEIRKKTLGEDHVNVGASYYTIGNLYGSIFNYRRAIYFIEQGNLIMEAKYGEGAGILHTYYAYLGSMYGFVGEHDKATYFLHLAEKLAEENLRSDHPYLGIVYAFIGDYYYREKNVDLQVSYFEKARNIYLKAYGSGTIREADALVRLGEANVKLKNTEKADDFYDQALTIYQEKLGPTNSKVSGLYQNLGKVYSDGKDYEKALDFYTKSLHAISIDSSSFLSRFDVTTFTHKHRAMRSFQQLGRINRKLYNQSKKLEYLEASFKNHEFALELIDFIISSYKLEISKNQLEDESRSVYEEAMRVAYDLYLETEQSSYKHSAFKLVEKSKSPILLSKIRDAESKKYNNVPEALLAKERDINIELSYFKQQLRKANSKLDSTAINIFQKKVFDAQVVVENFKNELQERFPSYYDHQYNLEVADLAKVRELLPRSAVVLEYFESAEALYLFIISKKDFELIRVPLDGSFEEVINGYQKSLTDGDFIVSNPNEADSLFASTSSYLFNLLIQPATEYLTGKSQLVIIPDGKLSAINFNTFLKEKPTGKLRYSELSYLLKDYDISYAYSSSLNFRPNTNSYSFSFGGFAPSYSISTYANLDSAIHPMAHELVRDGKLPLPGAISEVSELSDFLNGESWINQDATESNFKEKAGDYSVLHLAMHSLLNGEDPAYSELLFNSEEDAGNDGYLTIEEIYNLELNAEMVVLSACSSGSGKIQVGEGPISFTRAFSYAGCPSVVMSMWKIPDASTKELMISFYKNLKNGMGKDAALRAAQLHYLTTTSDPLYQHPFFWGSFVAMGNTNILQTTTTFRKSMAIVISLVVLIGFFRIRKKIHRVNR